MEHFFSFAPSLYFILCNLKMIFDNDKILLLIGNGGHLIFHHKPRIMSLMNIILSKINSRPDDWPMFHLTSPIPCFERWEASRSALENCL